jgi:hypothetical protein
MRGLCASCGYFQAPKKAPPDVDASRDVFHIGVCKRFPTALSKNPSDWCGEYRDQRLFEGIGDNAGRTGHTHQGESAK